MASKRGERRSVANPSEHTVLEYAKAGWRVKGGTHPVAIVLSEEAIGVIVLVTTVIAARGDANL